MDRNYFLSCSHRIAFLLVMLAVGNLNAKFISTIIRRHNTVLNFIDVDHNNQQRRLTGFSAFKLAWIIQALPIANGKINHHKGGRVDSVDKAPSTVIQQRNFLTVDNTNFFFLRTVPLVPIWGKWTNPSTLDSTGTIAVFEKIKIFHTNFLKLVDGFQFIIKIPDKLTRTFI